MSNCGARGFRVSLPGSLPGWEAEKTPPWGFQGSWGPSELGGSGLSVLHVL